MRIIYIDLGLHVKAGLETCAETNKHRNICERVGVFNADEGQVNANSFGNLDYTLIRKRIKLSIYSCGLLAAACKAIIISTIYDAYNE